MSSLNETVLLSGGEAFATLPEGTQRKMKLGELMGILSPRVPDTCGAVLPEGVRTSLPVPGGMVLVHVTPPRLFSFKWIAEDSEAEFGPGTSYRTVRLALPYVYVIAPFAFAGRGVPALSDVNECYFSNLPIEAKGLDTPLLYPALLNCSAIRDGLAKPLSWICTQHLDRSEMYRRDTPDAVMRSAVDTLLGHLFESGFNRSSENHEGASGFGVTVDAKVDPRVESVEAWERATSEDPLFAIDVPWHPTGLTLREAALRERDLGRRGRRKLDTAAEIARLIFKQTGGKGNES